MTNHPRRSTRWYQFIAFSMITGTSLARGPTARAAIEAAIEGERMPGARYIEALDCGANGRKVWDETISLAVARKAHRTVFRGDGYADTDSHLSAVALID